jgi:cell wall-associated NlpC family hydrolase
MAALAFVASAHASITAMRPGDEGTAVELLQQALQDKGYYSYPQITGYYGAETEVAVTNFQLHAKLGRDGVAGKYTLRALFGSSLESVMKNASLQPGSPSLAEAAQREEASAHIDSAPTISAPTISVPAPTANNVVYNSDTTVLKNGMKGEAVLAVQRRLVSLGYLSSADGDFGSQTEQALRRFQSASGILSDGEAGPITVAALSARDAIPYALVASKVSSGSGGAKGAAIVEYAKQFLGVKYVYATAGPNTFDCSGLTLYVYKNFGISLPHTSRLQGEMGTYLTKDDLQIGDLVFFDTVVGNGLQYDHVGIYIADGSFIHAASGSAGKVTISSLSSGYYQNTFVCGRRLL